MIIHILTILLTIIILEILINFNFISYSKQNFTLLKDILSTIASKNIKDKEKQTLILDSCKKVLLNSLRLIFILLIILVILLIFYFFSKSFFSFIFSLYGTIEVIIIVFIYSYLRKIIRRKFKK